MSAPALCLKFSLAASEEEGGEDGRDFQSCIPTSLNYEEFIKYFVKNDFYLADTLAVLEEQIYICIHNMLREAHMQV